MTDDRRRDNTMTLEEFILAYDPYDCGTLLWLGAERLPLRSSLLSRLREEIIPEREDEDDERITSLDDLVQWAGNERELADCETIWNQFQDYTAA
jgi:hypothetical protein